jgi:O-antigen ligase
MTTQGLVIHAPARGLAAARAARAWFDELPGTSRLALVFGVHLMLGLAMRQLAPAATLHTFATILAVLAISLYTKNPAVVLMCACYVSGAEVLWRMSKSYTFHETAKYMVSLLCFIGLIRMKRVRLPGHAVLYLALLLPAAVFPFVYFSFDLFRRHALFHLSGPIALTMAVLFCSNLRISAGELWRACVAFAAPLCGVLAVTVRSSYMQDVKFGTESNFQTSGGFGPNQVASSLAMGALLVLMGALLARTGRWQRVMLAGLAAAFTLQSAMTFSRGGVISLGLALVVAGPLVLSGHRYKRQILAGVVGVALVLAVAFPLVNAYTGGKLAERFAEKKMSGREKLAAADWEVFQEHPMFGVGVGISKYFHPGAITAHTEYTRALSEHGLLGVAAYLALFWLLLRRGAAILEARESRPYRGLLLALMVWPLTYMVVNAMRTSAPGLAIGMAFLTVLPGAVLAQKERFAR